MASNQYQASNSQVPASNPRPFIIPIFIPHAGCPHQCVFWNQVSITGVKQKMATPAELYHQIREFLKYKQENRKPVQRKEIRDCFYSADQSKIANCASASAAAQHIEASIKRNQ